MSLKRKLLVTIIMFCTAVSLLMVGVWAVSTDNFDFSGTIQFFASDVNVTISGSMVGAKTNATYTTLTYKPATSTTAETKPTQAALNSWKNKIDFKPTADDIILTITITNNGIRPIYVSLVDQSSATNNILKAFQASNETYSLDTQKEISPNGSLIFTITFSVDDIATEINGGYKFFVNLEDERADFDYVATPGLVYTYSSSAPYTATVSGYNGDSSVVVVPAKVRNNGNTYSVTSIGESAFREVDDVTSITIPASVTSIGNDAFAGCINLETVVVERETPATLSTNVFDSCHSNLKIYVPADSVNAYKSASGWSTYASRIFSIDEMPASVSAVDNVVDEVIVPASYGKRED